MLSKFNRYEWLYSLLYVLNLSQCVKICCKSNAIKTFYVFANHFLPFLADELQIKEITMVSDKIGSERYNNKIKLASDNIHVDHSWQQGDVVMVDNIRFMHGKRSFEKGDPRDILTIQTARANFGFCSDTRLID